MYRANKQGVNTKWEHFIAEWKKERLQSHHEEYLSAKEQQEDLQVEKDALRTILIYSPFCLR